PSLQVFHRGVMTAHGAPLRSLASRSIVRPLHRHRHFRKEKAIHAGSPSNEVETAPPRRESPTPRDRGPARLVGPARRVRGESLNSLWSRRGEDGGAPGDRRPARAGGKTWGGWLLPAAAVRGRWSMAGAG